ncbi:Mn2+/Fe2- transporter, NRAMP family [Deinococcus proteolyticus MRP]|uniref:Mn2+/Fe2-transporter, NRAMP family n=2 Tax=Deinococcus proteolyticus TaxID=55148 RepID=F0RJQ1_DEIPM|nr:NRAMP family divalent metal transporter [Deinococcus sp. SL84]ADY25527.1 Mn2+/Fe2- transporter, NRAMP family [Deinococcus proteolyticus MRP]MCY1701647.1 divalent metal cation transporter [Deinococcus sp. SL84]
MLENDMQAAVPSSTWQTRLAALGPGIMMASAAIGGSHIVSSAQAGALFGWQLAGLILLTNLLKYPFFRFGPQYTMESGQSLVEGYARKGRGYLWVFFILCAVSSVISTAGVGLLSAVILNSMLPAGFALSGPVMASVMMLVVWVLLVAGHYKALDGITKLIVIGLTVATVAATFIAASKGSNMVPGFVEPSPWNLATLPFLVALVGWMPAPIEISAINSMWIKAKQKISPANYADTIFDFNVGYVTSAVLAIFFVAMGALVQYGNGEKLEPASAAYISQLVQMYGSTIGEWSKPVIAFIAFMCMFGTTITVVDGYARASGEALRLLRGDPELKTRDISLWITGISVIGLAIILLMQNQLAGLLKFAMTSAFVTAPIFAWLNLSLVSGERHLSGTLRALAYAGLAFLVGFTLLFLANLLGLLG